MAQTHRPFRCIRKPHQNDVLCGRGGLTNKHPGNVRFRLMLAEHKDEYLTLEDKNDKTKYSQMIVDELRGQHPPVRFLKKDKNSNLWCDVGDIKARKKVSQLLREGRSGGEIKNVGHEGQVFNKAASPTTKDEVRLIDENYSSNGSQHDFSNILSKSASIQSRDPATLDSFGTKTNAQKKQGDEKRSFFLQSHSLGREHLEKGEVVAVGDFSWPKAVQGCGRGLATHLNGGVDWPRSDPDGDHQARCDVLRELDPKDATPTWNLRMTDLLQDCDGNCRDDNESRQSATSWMDCSLFKSNSIPSIATEDAPPPLLHCGQMAPFLFEGKCSVGGAFDQYQRSFDSDDCSDCSNFTLTGLEIISDDSFNNLVEGWIGDVGDNDKAKSMSVSVHRTHH